MIKQAINQWNNHKNELKKYFETHGQSNYDEYKDLVDLVVKYILNADGEDNMGINSKEISVIDDGRYSGTLIFVMHKNRYEPDLEDYYWTHNFYGSCSGCDALLRISRYDEGLPNEEQVKEYMNLCLHIIQRLKPLVTEEYDYSNELDEY